MLGTLQLEKFRGFETYALTDLTRVNLLVGKNNCGKTSILEAIHFWFREEIRSSLRGLRIGAVK